jgi:hypothetical protein
VFNLRTNFDETLEIFSELTERLRTLENQKSHLNTEQDELDPINEEFRNTLYENMSFKDQLSKLEGD